MGRRRNPISLEFNKARGRREYRARVYDANGRLHRSWLQTDDLNEALKRYQEFQQAIDREFQRTYSLTLSRLLDKFIADLSPRLSANTIRAYESSLSQYFMEFLEREGIGMQSVLAEADIRGYPAFLAGKDLKTASVNHHIRNAKAFLNYFDCPKQAKSLRLLQEPKKSVRTLSPDEVRQIVGKATPIYRVMILTLLFTGLSRKELLTLEWEQIDLQKRVIRAVRGIKRRRERHIPIHSLLWDIIKEMPLIYSEEGLPSDSAFVFPSPNGQQRDLDAFTRYFGKLVKSANIEHCTPHDLRRTFISNLVSGGYPLEIAQELAGHADPRVTQEYYLNIRASALRGAIESLPCPI